MAEVVAGSPAVAWTAVEVATVAVTVAAWTAVVVLGGDKVA